MAIANSVSASRQLGLGACVAGIILVGSSCASGVASPPAVTPAAAATPPRQNPGLVTAAPLPTDQYFSEATAIDLFEIRAAEIALQRSSGTARSFALQTAEHHRALSAQLAFAGRYLNLLPSRYLAPEYQQMLDQLSSATDLDRLYFTQQRLVCARALQLHSRYATSGASPTLRPVAQFGVSVINADLQLLRR